jgi:RNA polymerase sigma-54 factor
MKPSLQVRLSQHLALTPQLQQSIRLLQLSTLELQQEVEQMLEQNPFLEPEEEGLSAYENSLTRSATDAPPDRAEDAAYSSEGVAAEASGESSEATGELRGEDFGTVERDDWSNGTEGEDFDGIRETPSSAAASSGSHEGGEDGEAHDRRSVSVSLAEHLRAQIAGMRLSPEDHAALHVLTESLNGDGYLADTLEEIADGLLPDGANAEAKEEINGRLRCALGWLQSLDPPGVGARDLGECLCLQLRAQPAGAARELAERISRKYLDLLARRDFKRLSSLTGASEELLKVAHGLIVQCEPKPGRPFSEAESNIIVPDVIVRKSGRGFSVALNPDVMPKLKVNDLFAQAARGQRGANANPNFSARLQEARWFVKNIQQRFDTILRVSRAIVERQKAFFSHGAIAMKPLVLREIADELGLHESTISRVTTAKYMTTPQGTFELKHFFGSSLNTEAGGNASSTAVRALIQQFVAAESDKKPLSDSQLSTMLEEQGIQVARRTVAKYREALRIAPATLRRAM